MLTTQGRQSVPEQGDRERAAEEKGALRPVFGDGVAEGDTGPAMLEQMSTAITGTARSQGGSTASVTMRTSWPSARRPWASPIATCQGWRRARVALDAEADDGEPARWRGRAHAASLQA